MTFRRKPYGCVFCPISVLALRDDHRQVAHALLNLRGTTHRTRAPAHHESVGRLVGVRDLDVKAVEIDALFLLLRVRDRAADQLAHHRRGGLARELELVERDRHVLAAHHVEHHARLARRDACILEAGFGFHDAAFSQRLPVRGLTLAGPAALRSEAWPANVRVGANSPSLWPTMFSLTNTVMNLRPLCTAKLK